MNFQAVMPPVRQVVGNHDRLRRRVEAAVDVVETHDAVDLGDVEVAVVKRDAVRPVQARGDLVAPVRPAVTVVVHDRVDCVALPQPAGADEDCSGGALGKGPRKIDSRGDTATSNPAGSSIASRRTSSSSAADTVPATRARAMKKATKQRIVSREEEQRRGAGIAERSML